MAGAKWSGAGLAATLQRQVQNDAEKAVTESGASDTSSRGYIGAAFGRCRMLGRREREFLQNGGKCYSRHAFSGMRLSLPRPPVRLAACNSGLRPIVSQRCSKRSEGPYYAERDPPR